MVGVCAIAAIVTIVETVPVFEDFGRRLDVLDEPPGTERAVVQLLAQSILEGSSDLKMGDVVFESPSGSDFIDLLVRPHDLLMEVKYHRPIPSGRNRPLTAQFGEVLNDMRKLAVADATSRIMVLVTDEAGLTHLRNKAMLPVRAPNAVTLDDAKIRSLARTAQRHAVPQGTTWVPVSVRRIWNQRLPFGQGIAWEVIPRM